MISGHRQRRTRVVSCTECHRRKQKCDRESPCNQCILRKVENLCLYTNENRRHRQHPSAAAARAVQPATTQHHQVMLSSTSFAVPYQQQYYVNTVSPYYAAAAAAAAAGVGGAGAAQHVPSAAYGTTPGRQVSSGSDHSLSTSDDSESDNFDDTNDDDTNDENDNATSNAADLADTLGYFRAATSNVAQDIKEMAPKIVPVFSKQSPGADGDAFGKSVFKSRDHRGLVNRLFRSMPPRPYVDLLVDIFFDEANFYRAVNRVKFLEDVSKWWHLDDRTTLEAVETGCLMFRVLSIAVVFVPDEHVATIKEIDSNFGNLTRDYHAVASELADLLPDTVSLIIEHVLRASWYKCDGRMKDSWYCITQAVRRAQEISLNVEPPGTPPTYERELRRRTWWILYYWDRFFGLTLSRPFVISDEVSKVPFPLDLDDADYYPTVNTNGPTVTPFTLRLMQYHLGKYMTTLDSDPALLYANLCSYVASLPGYLQPQRPDTSYDQQYPFLAMQRERLTGTICMVACAVYRRGINMPNPLSFCLRLLSACAVQFKTMQNHHYAQFIHTYRNLEPSVLICRDLLREIKNEPGLAERGYLLRASTTESNNICDSEFTRAGINAWTCLEAAEGGLYRLHEFRKNNRMAGYAYKVLKTLITKVRAELRGLQHQAIPVQPQAVQAVQAVPAVPAVPAQQAVPAQDSQFYMYYHTLPYSHIESASTSTGSTRSSRSSPPVDYSYNTGMAEDKFDGLEGTDFALDWFHDAHKNDLCALLVGGNGILSDFTGLEIGM